MTFVEIKFFFYEYWQRSKGAFGELYRKLSAPSAYGYRQEKGRSFAPRSFSFVPFFAVLVIHLVAERNNHIVQIIIVHISRRPSDTTEH